MGYTEQAWKSRIAQRSDVTTGLVHLTRDSANLKALDVLLKILKERRLIGSAPEAGFIVGKRRAVCFQEAPMYSLAQNIYTEQVYREVNKSAKVRYLGFGLHFSKHFIFERGGRPVIYERTSIAKSFLPKSEWWRIVNFDLSDPKAIIDWTHEREWRVPDDLEFSLSDVTVVLPNSASYQLLVKKCLAGKQEEMLASINGVVQLAAVFY